jgi:hypothetical protein
MPEPRFLVIGHSHAACIIEALRSAEPERKHGYAPLTRSQAKSPAARLARFLRKKTELALAKRTSGKRECRDPLQPIVGAAAAEIRRAVVNGLAAMLEPPRRVRARDVPPILEDAGITVLASVGGNAHNVFGLVEFEVPFDFVLPEREDLGADPTRQLIPYDAVHEVLGDRIRRSLRELALLQDAIGERMLVLESPPPIGDDAHVLKHSGHHFCRHYGDDWQVVSPALRYKFWRVSSAIYAAFCRQRGVTFVPAPADTMERGMFLKPEGWPPNATHANSWYGVRVIEAVRGRAGPASAAEPSPNVAAA